MDDEVETLKQAGARVGAAVGTGLREARRGARRGGQASAELSRLALDRVEQQLASHGVAVEDVPRLLAEKTTGMSRKQLLKQGKKARKQFEKQAAQARQQLDVAIHQGREQLAEVISPAPKKRNRWWLWALLVAASAGAVAVVLRGWQRSAEAKELDEEAEVDEDDAAGE